MKILAELEVIGAT